MTTLYTQITVNAPVEKIWEALSVIDNLDKFDPTVKKSTAITDNKSGIHAKRKVDMLDGKNWFEEKVTEFKPYEALTYQLTDCSFPINGLSHSYSFEKIGNQSLLVKKSMPVLSTFMPDLTGLSPREVTKLFKDRNIDIELVGKGIVENYTPSVGTDLDGIKKIKLYLKEKNWKS